MAIKINRLLFLYACLCAICQGYGQADTTLDLEVVTITASRLRGWQPGQPEIVADSMQLSYLQGSNVTELLHQEGGVYVRDYGAGNIATASIRGASASQTAVLWNGLPIQDPMLGLADLSLLPLFMFEQPRLVVGGNSSLWGSGAMGGAIHLDSRLPVQPGWRLNYFGEAGSFGHWGQGLKANYAARDFSSSTRLFARGAANDYLYRDLFGEEKRLPHAATRQHGILQENRFRLGARQRLNVHLWWQEAARQIPPSRVQAMSAARQEDEALRMMADWQWAGEQQSWAARAALFRTGLLYEDTLSNLFTDSRTYSGIGEIEHTRQLAAGLLLKGGLHYHFLSASSTAYDEEPRQQRLAFFAALHWSGPHERWTGVLSGRQEAVDGRATPFTPSLSLRLVATPWLVAGLAASRNYRLPTFNDLYWPEGGNPELQPEKGWQQSLFLRAGSKVGWPGQVSLTGFNYLVDNWILWLPRNGIFSPDNVRRVWSRGGEARWAAAFPLSFGTLAAGAQYTYTRSTNEQTARPDDPALGRQLLYVPRHQGRFRLSWSHQRWQAAYRHEWTGIRFTDAANSQELPAFSTGSFHLSYRWERRRWAGNLYGRLENSWDEDYALILHRPMPGRHYRLGIQIQFSNTP